MLDIGDGRFRWSVVHEHGPIVIAGGSPNAKTRAPDGEQTRTHHDRPKDGAIFTRLLVALDGHLRKNVRTNINLPRRIGTFRQLDAGPVIRAQLPSKLNRVPSKARQSTPTPAHDTLTNSARLKPKDLRLCSDTLMIEASMSEHRNS